MKNDEEREPQENLGSGVPSYCPKCGAEYEDGQCPNCAEPEFSHRYGNLKQVPKQPQTEDKGNDWLYH